MSVMYFQEIRVTRASATRRVNKIGRSSVWSLRIRLMWLPTLQISVAVQPVFDEYNSRSNTSSVSDDEESPDE
jgi:hypothetical protein